LNDKTCQSLGFDDGTLSCRSDCTFNTSGCCLGGDKQGCNVDSDCCGFNIPGSSSLYCSRFNSTLSYCCNKGSYAVRTGCEVHISCSPVCVFNNNFLTNPGCIVFDINRACCSINTYGIPQGAYFNITRY